MTTIAQRGEIQKQLHNMMKYMNNWMVKSTNNCTTWWNPQTIVQHSEIHPNNTLTTPKQHSTETILQQHLIITIEQHGEIHNQLHNKVKYTEITQHCEILKHLHYIVKFTNDIKESKDSPNRNCKNSCSCSYLGKGNWAYCISCYGFFMCVCI